MDAIRDVDDSKEAWRFDVRILDVWSMVNNKVTVI
jgi:hypothetical protein